jgi:eukaryotic-like serine/threonine-protein kinase
MDRCAVCHTPVPRSVSSGDPDKTRLAETGTDSTSARAAEGRRAPILEPGQTFAKRYTIIRRLGAGGMGAVYQAWDESLNAAVALKLIRIDSAMDPADIRQLEERFKRELKLARQVTHPNVVRIHDLGEVEGTLYLTMACVQGSDLATVLGAGRLPVPRALSLARQMASGLAAAHRAGIVHRDLKPANILVDSDDHALLTDFGIARSRSAATIFTMPGSFLGTIDYMAPEQARGEPADERTDIYAFGLILYEMLAGSRPGRTKEGGLADLIARLEQGPPQLRSVVPDVPADLERIVGKCLEANPGDRYATAEALVADLDALGADGRIRPASQWRFPVWTAVVLGVTLAAVLMFGTWWMTSRGAPPASAPHAPVQVLIVDFDNRTQEPIFEGTLEQALSLAIEGAPFVTAYPRRDALKVVRTLQRDALDENSGRLVATREGIPVILAGSIQRDGGGYRIDVRAVDPAKPDPPLANASGSASDKGDVLPTVVKVAERLRKALGDTSPSARQQAETFTASSLDAIREYTIAQDLASDQKDKEAVVHYREALKYDPDFGRAYAGLATSLHYLGQRPESAKMWDEALKRLDRMSEREQLRTTGIRYAMGRNYEKSIEAYSELVRKYPADRAGQNNLAVAYFSTLNFAKAREHGQLAIAIYPKSFKFRANYALYAMYAGDFSTAATTARKLAKEDPTFETAYLPLAMEALAAGDPARARSSYEQAAKAGEAGASLAAIGLADIAIYQGKYDEAIAALPDAAARDEKQQNSSGAESKLLALAEAHAARGQWTASEAALARARKLGTDDSVLVTSARLAIAGKRLDDATAIAAELGARLPAQSRAYGKLIDAEIALATRRYPEAIDALNAAKKLSDLWLVRYVSGRAYFEAGDYPAAISEFVKCQERRGEATSIFLDDLPTYRYMAPVSYWLGRSREAGKLDPRQQYEEFLAIRGGAVDDPLVADARRRISGTSQQ